MRFRLPRRSATACALISLLTLAACATLGTSSHGKTEPSSFCLLAKPIRFSARNDTLETIAQVKEHNAVGKKLCGWGTGAAPSKFPNSEAATPPP